MARYNATFTSEWDGGIQVNARCRVNTRTRMVTAMGKNDFGRDELLEVCECEYVTLDKDGKKYKAEPLECLGRDYYNESAREKDVFYYE